METKLILPTTSSSKFRHSKFKSLDLQIPDFLKQRPTNVGSMSTRTREFFQEKVLFATSLNIPTPKPIVLTSGLQRVINKRSKQRVTEPFIDEVFKTFTSDVTNGVTPKVPIKKLSDVTRFHNRSASLTSRRLLRPSQKESEPEHIVINSILKTEELPDDVKKFLPVAQSPMFTEYFEDDNVSKASSKPIFKLNLRSTRNKWVSTEVLPKTSRPTLTNSTRTKLFGHKRQMSGISDLSIETFDSLIHDDEVLALIEEVDMHFTTFKNMHVDSNKTLTALKNKIKDLGYADQFYKREKIDLKLRYSLIKFFKELERQIDRLNSSIDFSVVKSPTKNLDFGSRIFDSKAVESKTSLDLRAFDYRKSDHKNHPETKLTVDSKPSIETKANLEAKFNHFYTRLNVETKADLDNKAALEAKKQEVNNFYQNRINNLKLINEYIRDLIIQIRLDKTLATESEIYDRYDQIRKKENKLIWKLRHTNYKKACEIKNMMEEYDNHHELRTDLLALPEKQAEFENTFGEMKFVKKANKILPKNLQKITERINSRIVGKRGAFGDI